jgi:hypothetical protein
MYDVLNQSSQMLERAITSTDSSPSQRAERREGPCSWPTHSATCRPTIEKSWSFASWKASH